jgi:two-component system OmpR family response regulator
VRILLVEDNSELARQIQQSLEASLFVIDIAGDGREGRFLGETEPYDLVILDLGLPYIDGLSVLTAWRESGNNVPVLILTSRDTWREKVTGLRAGADDYLAKPFEMEELQARVEALLRRSSGHPERFLSCGCGSVKLDTSEGRVTLHGQRIELTAYEFRTLDYLMRNLGRAVSKTELIEHIYHQDFDLDSNVIEVLINRLRHKLGSDVIQTHRGLGYFIPSSDDCA